jgi:O-methyltransferase involved in polyketide biosynthesis
MQMDNSPVENERDFGAISPSAKALLMMKGITNIPFARETAALVSLPELYEPDINNKDIAFWKRVVHFESRYWSVDQLLSEVPVHNIMELSSGYGCRGFDMVKRKQVHYIDTDLPEMIAEKQKVLERLRKPGETMLGELELKPLNALDSNEFFGVVNSFADGPVIIVNEGLLMYLRESEKEKLCGTIHAVLKNRGGFWITGDVYIRTTLEPLMDKSRDVLKQIVDEQRTEDNMFESFEAAEAFFERNGFVVDKEAEPQFEKLSALKYLIGAADNIQLAWMQKPVKMQASWRLKAK